MNRVEALEAVVELTEDVPVVITCAATSREMAFVADRDNHLYLLDSMGLAISVGTGLALALDETSLNRVVVVEGDGSLLMNLNALATTGFLKPRNLVVVLLDNTSYASTAGIPTYSEILDLGAIARSVGIEVTVASDRPSLARGLADALQRPGPHFLHVRIDRGNSVTPLLLLDPVFVKHRFESWLSKRAYGQEAAPEPTPEPATSR